MISSSFAVENNSNIDLENRISTNLELDIINECSQKFISLEDARLIALMNYRGEIKNENKITDFQTGNILYLFTIKDNNLNKLVMVDGSGEYNLIETLKE